MRRELTLLVPGLFGPLPGVPADQLVPGEPLPGLEGLLARAPARVFPARSPERALLRLFGCDPEAAGVAATSYLGDTGHSPEGPLLRADPVYMRAATGALMQFDGSGLGLEQSEADALVAACNELLEGDGAQLSAPAPHRWYLHLKRLPRVRTRPLSETRGVDLTRLMPTGEEGAFLRGLLTELQMVLTDHRVNRERERAGRPAANSLWLWGEGDDPQPEVHCWNSVCSEDPLARGLAVRARVPARRLPDDAGPVLAATTTGPELVMLDQAWQVVQYGDPREWMQVLQALERSWFRPVWQALRRRQLGRVHVLPLDGRAYRAGRADRWRLWRPRRSVARLAGAT
ncbi:MAG TPA: hypothetical protein VFA95_12120 [Gammaproteobacteria bacterium]|nr:hypothetical protein [Gammaproteobacteria bacterium]